MCETPVFIKKVLFLIHIFPAHATSLLDVAERFVGMRGLFCSQFVTNVVESYNPGALKGAVRIPCQASDLPPYVSVAGFINLYMLRDEYWKSLPPKAQSLRSNTILSYYPVSYSTPPEPHTVALQDRHICIVREVKEIRQFGRMQAIFVEVIDSTSRTDREVKEEGHEVSVNQKRVFISDNDGVLLGFQWIGRFDAEKISRGEFFEKNFALACLEDN
jgi:hypothetical protein